MTELAPPTEPSAAPEPSPFARRAPAALLLSIVVFAGLWATALSPLNAARAATAAGIVIMQASFIWDEIAGLLDAISRRLLAAASVIHNALRTILPGTH